MAKLTSIEPFPTARTSLRPAVNLIFDFSSLRLVIGAVLLIAALFKIRYLEYYPPDIFSASRSAWLLFAASEYELCRYASVPGCVPASMGDGFNGRLLLRSSHSPHIHWLGQRLGFLVVVALVTLRFPHGSSPVSTSS